MNFIYAPLPDGPSEQTPRRIIVHSMGELIDDGTDKLHAINFLKKLGLSAHILVAPNGDVIRCREDNQGAWHAKGFNTDSLGIEILVPGVHDYASFLEAIKTDWCTPEAFKSAVEMCRHWMDKYGRMSMDRHSDVDPERKYDPGSGFDWHEFQRRVRDEVA